MSMRRDVIRFDTEPVKVKLDKGPYAGIECHGQYGIDWRYSVNDGKAVMYLPEEARDALIQTGVSAGEEVAIRRLGKSRWEVERIEPDLPFPNAETAQSKATPESLTPIISNPNARSAPERPFVPPERAESSARPADPDAFVLPPSAVTASKHMMSCYCVAVEVAVEVQEYARRKGMHIAFTGSDIRAMGITVYIGDNQRLREAS
jgi:hypothetical protein